MKVFAVSKIIISIKQMAAVLKRKFVKRMHTIKSGDCWKIGFEVQEMKGESKGI